MSPFTADAQALTAPNTILGTAPYMAPEQVRGKDADTRSDVWAWGVVVYEMVTGRSPFGSATLADTIAAILHQEPEWGDVPEPLRQLLGLCLRKDAADRLQNIADARVLLTDVPPQAARAHQKRVWLAAAAAAVLLDAATAMLVYWPEPGPSMPALVRFTVAPPPGWSFGTYAVMSPDGRHHVFQAHDKQGRRTLAVHSFASGQSAPLPRAGEIDGASIFWSADSRFIGFVGVDGNIKKIDVEGGAPRTICSLAGNWGGATWNTDDVIVFGQRAGPLMRVIAIRRDAYASRICCRARIGHGGPRFLPEYFDAIS